MKNFSVIIDKATIIFKIKLLLGAVLLAVSLAPSQVQAQDVYVTWQSRNDDTNWTNKDNWQDLITGTPPTNFPNGNNVTVLVTGTSAANFNAKIPAGQNITIKEFSSPGNDAGQLEISKNSSLTVTGGFSSSSSFSVSGDGDFIVKGDFSCKDFEHAGNGNVVFGGAVTISGNIKIGGQELKIKDIKLSVAPLGGNEVFVKFDGMDALGSVSASFVDSLLKNLFQIAENNTSSSSVSVSSASLVRDGGQVSWVRLSHSTYSACP